MYECMNSFTTVVYEKNIDNHCEPIAEVAINLRS